MTEYSAMTLIVSVSRQRYKVFVLTSLKQVKFISQTVCMACGARRWSTRGPDAPGSNATNRCSAVLSFNNVLAMPRRDPDFNNVTTASIILI